MSNNMPGPRTARLPAQAAEPAPVSMGMLPDLVGYHVRLAQMAIFADFERTLGELELSPGLFALLVIVEANPGLNQARLAQAARLERSSLVPALDKLEARGLLARRDAPGDRRANGLHLTEAGAALMVRAKAAVRRHEARLAGHLEPGARELLVSLLSGIFPEDR